MPVDSFFYLLLLTGFCAGLMDAAVGGGGLLQIPGLFNLLPTSTPVASVMGVNKFASCCGTVTATGQYLRRIPVPWKMLLPAAVLAFAASYLGAKAVVFFPVQYMKPAMLVIMIAMCVYTFIKKDLGQTVRTEKLTRRETLWGLFFGALIGFYDGIFGPGTGSLFGFRVRPFLRLRFFDGKRIGQSHQLDHQSRRADIFYPARARRLGVGNPACAGEFVRRRGRCEIGDTRRHPVSALWIYGVAVSDHRQIRLGFDSITEGVSKAGFARRKRFRRPLYAKIRHLSANDR